MPKNEWKIKDKIIQEERKLAEGAFAFVWLSKDVHSGQEYALKKILCPDRDSYEIAEREVTILNQVSHPHIVTFHGHAVESQKGKHLFLLLFDLYPNGHLLDLIHQYSGKLPEELVVQKMKEVTSAVMYLHSLSPPLQHRDLKIENILLGPDSSCKLCDFGSCSTEVLDTKEADHRTLVRLEGEIEKYTTPMYRPPEFADVYQHLKISEKVDCWMLGCILFTLMFAYHPFGDATPLGVANAKYTIPSQHPFSRKLEDLTRRLLQLNPEDRPSSKDLHTFLSEWNQFEHLPPPTGASGKEKKEKKSKKEKNEKENPRKSIKEKKEKGENGGASNGHTVISPAVTTPDHAMDSSIESPSKKEREEKKEKKKKEKKEKRDEDDLFSMTTAAAFPNVLPENPADQGFAHFASFADFSQPIQGPISSPLERPTDPIRPGPSSSAPFPASFPLSTSSSVVDNVPQDATVALSPSLIVPCDAFVAPSSEANNCGFSSCVLFTSQLCAPCPPDSIEVEPNFENRNQNLNSTNTVSMMPVLGVVTIPDQPTGGSPSPTPPQVTQLASFATFSETSQAMGNNETTGSSASAGVGGAGVSSPHAEGAHVAAQGQGRRSIVGTVVGVSDQNEWMNQGNQANQAPASVAMQSNEYNNNFCTQSFFAPIIGAHVGTTTTTTPSPATFLGDAPITAITATTDNIVMGHIQSIGEGDAGAQGRVIVDMPVGGAQAGPGRVTQGQIVDSTTTAATVTTAGQQSSTTASGPGVVLGRVVQHDL